jgi:hypothetical protein
MPAFSRLGTIYGYRSKPDKGDDASRQPIDDEIARSLLDLSKGAEQTTETEDSQDSQSEKQGNFMQIRQHVDPKYQKWLEITP